MNPDLTYKSKARKIASYFLLITGLFWSNFNHSKDKTELPTLGDPTLDSFSSKEEAKLGQAFYQALRANLEFVEDIQLNHYIESLGQKLVSHSDSAGKTFHFFIIKSPVINAFAGPDAYIGLNSGLILSADNESQVAGVMAHEVSHVSQRHLARAIDDSGNTAIASFATVLAAIILGSQDAEAGQAALLTGIAGTQQASLNFTRSNEYEADRVGINILAKAGINPQGTVEFFELLLSEGGGSAIEYLRTHPLNVNRVSEAKDRIEPSQLLLPKDSEDFKFAKARLEVLTTSQPATLVEDSVATANNPVSQYRQAVALIMMHQPEKALPILTKLSANNRHPWVRLALAEAYLQANNQEAALALLKQTANLYPGYLPVTMAYAEALTNNRRAQESIKILNHQLQNNDDPVIHKALARAYFVNGQISAALESTGNQYAKEGYIELALQQYDNALKHPDTSETAKKRLETKKEQLKQRMK